VNTTLWIVQILLPLFFLVAGVTKVGQSQVKLEKSLPWTADTSLRMVCFIGTVEILGALGLVLPAATGIAPILAPLAAVGLAVVMLGAIATHARRREQQAIVVDVVLLARAAVVAWGRFGSYAF